MPTVGLEYYFLAIWRGLFQRTELHAWELKEQGSTARRRREKVWWPGGAGGGSRRRGTLLGLCWIFSTGHLFIPVSSPGLWASRSPRSCLIFLSPNPSAGWGRKAEGGGEQGSEEHPLGAKPLTGKARLPRDTARTAEGDWASSSQAPLGCLRLWGWPHDAHLTHLQMRSTSPSIPPPRSIVMTAYCVTWLSGICSPP